MNSNHVEYKLSKGPGYIILINKEDFHLLENHKISTVKSREFGHTRYVVCSNKKTRKYITLLHRMILKPQPFEMIDHINGNGLDCRRENLRIVSNSQNQMNRRPQVNFVKGVFFREDRQKWTARITINQKVLCLGSFSSHEEAINARLKAEKLHFKEFSGFGTFQE